MHTLLIANRGEIARRIIRTAHALGLEVVAVYSDADRDLPHVREADRAVRLGPPAVHASYLDAAAVLDAARRSGADSVHPGYGFLSENAGFAQAVVDAGLTWVGPSPGAIAAMGDKTAARRLAASLGVPTVPGFDASDDDAALHEAAVELGVPLLVKAAAGGGGRGMRRVDDLADFGDALASARREAQSAFGDGRVLLERYVERPRHVEVQVFGDSTGRVVHLGERDCSIQRRHQKVVEEAPCPVVEPALREQLGEAACRVASAVGYVGAGTVEFLLERSGAFWFLEMNTRLQVEHPVTEAVTGIDLVEWQLRVAMGEPLPAQIPELTGHAIEVRVYAEDSLRDHLPATGTLRRVHLPAGVGVRVDAGYADGDVVTPHYDPLVAKVIASGPDRATATRRLRRALDAAWLPGVVTNLPLLRQIVRHPRWAASDLDTAFLADTGLPEPPPLNLADGVTAAIALSSWQRRGPVPPAWRMGGAAEQTDRFRCGAVLVEARWTARVGGFVLTVLGETRQVEVLGLDGDRLRLVVDGLLSEWRVAWIGVDGRRTAIDDGDTLYVHTGRGEAFVLVEPRFPAPGLAAEVPGSCVAPTPGTVTAVHVAVGDAVEAGDKLVTVEAMKMEHTLTAPDDGTVVEVRVEAGEAVDGGTLLVRLEVE
ncbi:MAG: acetyl/propionyl-CoA carboxylase alpha subunit [Myxococcota bacterium]